MRVYWYWPYLRQEELTIATGVVQPGDRLVVDTTERVEEPVVSTLDGCVVRRNLANVEALQAGTPRWVVSRAATYARRAQTRRHSIRDGGFDVAHIVYLNRFVDAVDLRWLGRRVPLVSTVHDVVPHASRVPQPIERRILARQYRYGGTLITAHEVMRQRLVQEFDVDPARVVVLPQKIPVVPPRPPRRSDRRPTVLFFGTFRRNKGIAVLLDAIAQLDDDATFAFAGRGEADLEQLVVDAATRDPRITVELGYATGERKDELHAAADLVVLPYTSFASQSAVLNDAYAHALPLIVTDVGALGATVREEATGWVVRPADANALAAAITEALRNPAGRIAASEAQRAIATSRTPEVIGARTREIYEETVASWRECRVR